MISFGLAREVYGMNPWCMDESSLSAYLGILESIQKGMKFNSGETKYNTIQFLGYSNQSKLISTTNELKENTNFKGVGLIRLNGPITVSGGLSSHGMRYLSEEMLKMAEDKRIISFIVLANSGGGSSAAIDILADTILEVKNKKRKQVYGLVSKGGRAASACYGILTSCTSIYAESEMSIVGSIGTMIQFDGRLANSENLDGVKHIRLYATASSKKNIEFEEALKGNYKLIQEKLLNPVNENFIKMVLRNRPKLEGSGFDNGHTVFAKDAIGTFIDGLKSFNEVVQIALNTNSQTGGSNTNNVKSKSNTMNVEELKQKHPETYNEIYANGRKKGATEAFSNEEEINAFYKDVDEKLNSHGIRSSTIPKQEQNSYESEKIKAFYKDVDEKLKLN